MIRALPLTICIALGCLLGCGGPNKKQLAKYAPATLEQTPTAGETFTFRVRVYADREFRVQNQRWEQKIRVFFEAANAVTVATAGIRLELVETLPWSRAGSGAQLATVLSGLEDLDPGQDVHFVFGFVDALPDVSSTFHQIGLAHGLGKHAVIRGLNDVKEKAVLEEVLDDHDEQVRERLYRERAAHKMTALLLHELGHLLGVPHTAGDEFIMSSAYEWTIRTFAESSAKLMRAISKHRSADPTLRNRNAELQAYLTAFKTYETEDEWEETARNSMREHAEKWLSGLGGGTEAAEAKPEEVLSSEVRADHQVAYRDAMRLAGANQVLEAWEKAEPLFDFYPDEPAVRVLRCRLATARKLAEAGALCKLAANARPKQTGPSFDLAQTLLSSGDKKGAFDALARARKQLLRAENESAKSPDWFRLATIYRDLGLVSLALDASSRSEDGSEVLSWAKQQAAQFSVPTLDSKRRGSSFPPQLDAEYIEAVKAALKHVYARDFASALKSVGAGRRRFGKQAGFATVECDLEIRRRAYRVAARACKAALKLFPDGSWSHYLSGLLEKQAKRPRQAIVHLERAIELELGTKHAYQILLELYESAKISGKAASLREKYRLRFGATL